MATARKGSEKAGADDRRIRVDVVVVLLTAQDGRLKVLCLRQDKGVWALPKGTPGASEKNTAASATTDPGWHTGPARQFVITLAGSSEVEVSGGVHVLAGPGHINLIEDTTGKGHITRNFGPEDRIALTIPLADGVVIEGTTRPRTR